MGLIHFVGMSTEHNYTIGSPQYLWLENDLKNVDRSVTPWIVFGGHRAMYINSNYGGSVTSDIVVMNNLIANIEPLLGKYRVNLAFWGHNHAVQRHSAVYNSKVVQKSKNVMMDGENVAWHSDPQATVHLVVGTGGAMFTKNFVVPYPEWCELVFYQYGYSKVISVNSTYLEWLWVNNSNNVVLDRMVITQTTNFTEAWTLQAEVTDVTSDENSNKDDLGVGVIVGISIAAAFCVFVTAYVAVRLVSGKSIFGYDKGRSTGGQSMHILATSSNPNHI